jgi:multidrug efflux pump
MDRLKERVRRLEGTTLYMQPVQDLTIEDRVSRTQYQFTLASNTAEDLATWTPRLVDELRKLPQLADIASDLQDQGLQAYVTIDRDTAGRLGVTPAAIDNALYNAFGQRLVSTIFTQSSQYRVVLEVKPEFQRGPAALNDIYVPASGAATTNNNGTTTVTNSTGAPTISGANQVPLSAVATIHEQPGALSISHIAQFPATTDLVQPRRRQVARPGVDAIEKTQKRIAMPGSIRAEFQGAAAAFRGSLLNTLLLILAAIVTMYIVLGVLYESYIHPVTILSTLPRPAWARCSRCCCTGHDLGIIAIIGIILLIGIVKKNAILMIDFALEAEREQGCSRATRSTRPRCCASGRSS